MNSKTIYQLRHGGAWFDVTKEQYDRHGKYNPKRIVYTSPHDAAPCSNCNGTGWMVRDPDIGTDQECFVCQGKGFYEESSK